MSEAIPLKVGDRVRISASGRVMRQRRLLGRLGTVVRAPATSSTRRTPKVYVRWDGCSAADAVCRGSVEPVPAQAAGVC